MTIKPHILQISSFDKIDLLKCSLHALKMFGKTDFFSTIILNSMDSFENFDKNIFKNSEVILDKANYKDHPTTRWYIKPKSEVCLFLDNDIFACRDISPLIQLCHSTQTVCGVLALDAPFDENQCDQFKLIFEKCGVEYHESRKSFLEKNIPIYYNYGVLAIPSKFMEKIKVPLTENVKKINNYYPHFHAGQIALSITLKQLNIPTTDLPLRYNFYDMYPEILTKKYEYEYKNVVFKHFIIAKKTKIKVPFI
jgi:lipopolysaccharide biosynthesis glycosyltransferase